MRNSCKLSQNAKDYLSTFYCILDNMIEGMTTAELMDSISHNFIVQMIPHHCAAIEMSQNILRYTHSPILQKIANQIITEQTKSISNMEKALPCCSQLENTRQDVTLYQRQINQIMNTMFCEMEYAGDTNQTDTDFLREMIPHHRGAVKLSETTLQYEICKELVPILDAIITSQKKGIQQMEQLLHCIRN